MKGDGDTTPGHRGARGWSSRPPPIDSRISELPEPLIDPPPNRVAIEALQSHVVELHQDLRSTRTELTHKMEAARDAIYKCQAAVDGLRTVVEHALQMQRDDRARDRWVSVVGVTILTVLLGVIVARMYGLIGI